MEKGPYSFRNGLLQSISPLSLSQPLFPQSGQISNEPLSHQEMGDPHLLPRIFLFDNLPLIWKINELGLTWKMTPLKEESAFLWTYLKSPLKNGY